MSPRKLLVLSMLLVVAVVGCAEKKQKRQGISRMLRDQAAANNQQNASNFSGTTNSCQSYTVAGKQWGEVVMGQGQNQSSFWQEVWYLTYPSTVGLPEEDQLGYVSGTSGQSTGVRFWGNAQFNGSQLNASTAELRIEIYDDRSCVAKADGTTRSMIPIHISGKVDASAVMGGLNGNQFQLSFKDAYGTITLQGVVNGQNLNGTMKFTVSGLQGERFLGQFTVPKCGFFKC